MLRRDFGLLHLGRDDSSPGKSLDSEAPIGPVGCQESVRVAAGREGAGPTWQVRAGLGFAFSLFHLAGPELSETGELRTGL